MIIILKRNANPEKVEILKQELEHKGFKLHLSQGTQTSLIGLIGDTTAIHEDWLKAMDVVEDVRRIREPYKKASRSMHPENTVVDVCGQKIGGGHFQVIAGPCSIETREQITSSPGPPPMPSRDSMSRAWIFFWRPKKPRDSQWSQRS